MSILYPLTMICFGIYIGTYNNCKPAIEYIHETVISLCSDPKERPQYKRKQDAQVQTVGYPDDDDDVDDDDDIPPLKPIFE